MGKAHAVAVVSPGLLPIPPIIGGSVETVIYKMAEVTKQDFNIDIYGPSHRALKPVETNGGVTYHRFPAKPYSDYFKKVRAGIGGKEYSLVQVENRPLFIPQTKAANPGTKFILSLHSLDHIAERLIRASLTGKIFQMCDRVLVYSKFVCDRLESMFPRTGGRYCHIHLATEPEKFRPRWEPETNSKAKALKMRLGIPDRHKVVLFAGRVISKKGIDILLSAMERTIRVFPECCLVIVGSDWFGNTWISPYGKELRKKAKELGHRVFFTNYVPQTKLPLYFAMADVFVCPSQWDEPFGLVNVEAMATGVPVIASARGGIPEIVTHGVNGFLVKGCHNPESFVKPLLTLLKDGDTARSFGVAGRNAVETYFNWQRAGKDLVKLYQEILC